MKYQNKSFSVCLGGSIFSEGWDRVFKNQEIKDNSQEGLKVNTIKEVQKISDNIEYQE